MSRVSGNIQHLAFDLRSMDQSITAGSPNAPLEVIRGRFDPGCQQGPGVLLRVPSAQPRGAQGVPYYSWGEDYHVNPDARLAPPAFDDLGRGGRIAVLDEYLFRTLGTPEMTGLIDAHRKETTILADVEEFRLLAGGMSRLGAYTMLLSDDAEVWELDGLVRSSMGEDTPPSDIEKLKQKMEESGPRLRPFDAYATGAGKDEDGPYMALALVHAGGDSAEENVGLLRRRLEEGRSVRFDAPWSEFFEVDASGIEAEGRVLLAKLRPTSSVSVWIELVFFLDRCKNG